jgi:hypothetical protein
MVLNSLVRCVFGFLGVRVFRGERDRCYCAVGCSAK